MKLFISTALLCIRQNIGRIVRRVCKAWLGVSHTMYFRMLQTGEEATMCILSPEGYSLSTACSTQVILNTIHQTDPTGGGTSMHSCTNTQTAVRPSCS